MRRERSEDRFSESGKELAETLPCEKFFFQVFCIRSQNREALFLWRALICFLGQYRSGLRMERGDEAEVGGVPSGGWLEHDK